MSKYLGDFVEDATVRFAFNTRAKATGAPITLAGTPVIGVYKDGSATESTAGITLTVDFDSRTGHHLVVIDTSRRCILRGRCGLSRSNHNRHSRW